MTAYIVTIVVPNEFGYQEVLTACNIGLKKVVEEKGWGRDVYMNTNATIRDSFNLKRQDM